MFDSIESPLSCRDIRPLSHSILAVCCVLLPSTSSVVWDEQRKGQTDDLLHQSCYIHTLTSSNEATTARFKQWEVQCVYRAIEGYSSSSPICPA